MTTNHPHVPYDPTLVAEIADRMDLRPPNHEALNEVASRFDAAAGEPFEAVCDLATAVGKTYLAGGLIDYLALSGIRHFMIVVPGRTVLDKTINNLTAGHDKSILGGMETDPVVITADNFNTGSTGAALRNANVVKIFVFTVQSLIKPKKSDRRTRKHQEWLGEDLYAYLQGCDDLVVIADEHHVYSEKAASFSDAVRELDPMALIGLTATPAKSDLDKVIYKYELARAIADRFVKTPVLVGRKDDAAGVETQLRDGLLLLEAKQKAADEYAVATGKPSVNAVMFVVADTIDNANAVAEVLRKPGLFEHDYEQRVLVIHSEAPDDALARLDAVESPDSPVRVIVSVSMLKEGWDVKNIYVICSFRPSISEALTEQTLGRGLRLPWGEYTDVDLLDTVEVLSHERYQELLRKADVLLEGLTVTRAAKAADVQGGKPAAPGGTPTTPVDPDDTETAVIQVPAVPTGGGAATSPGGGADNGGRTGNGGGIAAEVKVTSVEHRTAEAQTQAEAVATPVEPLFEIRVPHVRRTPGVRNFSLSDVPDSEFVELGRRLSDDGDVTLTRKRLDVVADPTSASGYRLVPTEAAEVITASTAQLPYSNAKRALKDAILSLDIVTTDKANLNAADRLATAVVTGAGSEDALAAYLNATIAAARIIINKHYRKAPQTFDYEIEDRLFAPTRVNSRKVDENRYAKFDKSRAYSGWSSSQHSTQWFDSTPERGLANTADDDGKVARWSRIQRGELTIEWEDGRYSPDFYVEFDGEHYLVEVKADRHVNDEDVQAKKAAAERWARYVTDNGDHGTWHYVLVPQSVVETARTFPAVIQQASTV